MSQPPLILQVVQLVKRRRARRRAAQRSPSAVALRAAGWLLAAASLLLALLATAALPAYRYLTHDLPDVGMLPVLMDPQRGLLLQPSRLQDRTGTHTFVELAPPDVPRQFIELGQAPWLEQALIASSDPGFWQHSGAAWLESQPVPHTLAERVVTELLLAGEPEGWRKALRGRVLASEVTARYGQQQMLAWALNSARFGHWTFGAESAAQFYFGVPASQLTLAQAAALAAMANAPELDALRTPAAIQPLAHLVLVSMHSQGMLNDAQLAAALLEPLQFAASAQPLALDAFAHLALGQATQALGAERLGRGGLAVITTQDLDMQAAFAAQGRAALAVDALNGRILALAGDVDAPHAAGSVLLPFVYLDSFAAGNAPASLTWNFDAAATADLRGPLSTRRALANGLGQPAADALQQAGAHHTAGVLAAAGLDAFRSALSAPQAAEQILGDAAISPLELAAAYASLSTGQLSGQRVGGRLQLASLLFITDETGRILLDWSQPQFEALASAELAFLVSDTLSDVSVRPAQTRQRMLALGRPAALAPEAAASGGGWQLGYSPQRVVLSFGDADWAALFAAAHANLPIRDWQAPGGLSSVMVCVPSGQLPDEDCPQTRREYFVSGSEPRFADSLYERLAVNSLNGRLATVFTPAEFVHEQLFVNVPAALQAAAQAAGLPLPPADLDSVPAYPANSVASLLQPARFSSVSGALTVRGQAAAAAAGWDLQVGQGLYPRRWLQLASGSSTQPRAQWDTNGLSGLWVIQLQVWDEDGLVSRAYTVVTIENKADQ